MYEFVEAISILLFLIVWFVLPFVFFYAISHFHFGVWGGPKGYYGIDDRGIKNREFAWKFIGYVLLLFVIFFLLSGIIETPTYSTSFNGLTTP